MSATDSLTYMTFDLLVNGHHRLITNRVQSVVQSIILIYTLRIALDLQYQALVVLVFCVVFCRSLFVLFPFFFWLLCCLPFFDLRILITTLVSSRLFWPFGFIAPKALKGY